MSRIRIKNFGPIKEGYTDEDKGWFDIKKVTLFIGNQGSGKSTVAKLISTFTWIEKVLVRGDYDTKNFTNYNRFRKIYCAYHRLENYFFDSAGNDVADIAYHGDEYVMYYRNGKFNIEHSPVRTYPLPQHMYVPAERNFIANVKTPKALNLTSDSLVEFVTEFDNAKNEMRGLMPLPINGVDIEYSKLNDVLYIKGKDYRIKLTEASSGYQSLIPLFLVTWFLANSVRHQSENTRELMSSEQRELYRKQIQVIIENEVLTEEQKRITISEVAKKFNKSAFVNIVEEPEQNLFPSSQKQMLDSLLEFNNMNAGNKLIMTTHSPYMVNFISISIQAEALKGKIEGHPKMEQLLSELEKVININALVSSDDVAIYQLNEEDGSIQKLPMSYGIPSDKNYLNMSLRHGNEMFDRLLEIEQEL